jgi:hypothetical protein
VDSTAAVQRLRVFAKVRLLVAQFTARQKPLADFGIVPNAIIQGQNLNDSVVAVADGREYPLCGRPITTWFTARSRMLNQNVSD